MTLGVGRGNAIFARSVVSPGDRSNGGRPLWASANEVPCRLVGLGKIEEIGDFVLTARQKDATSVRENRDNVEVKGRRHLHVCPHRPDVPEEEAVRAPWFVSEGAERTRVSI
ncbi:hypothetical protein STEG23_002426 [Scotinomys teguina]